MVKTKMGKVWIPKDRVQEFIEYTHKIPCDARVKKRYTNIPYKNLIWRK